MRICVVLTVFLALFLTACTGSGGGGGEPFCEPETKKCDGNDVVRCNSAGTDWEFWKECDDDEACLDGECVLAGTPDIIADLVEDDLPDGTVDVVADLLPSEIAAEVPTDTNVEKDGTDSIDACEPSCGGKECGPDGCGDVCGSCADGSSCDEGKCYPDNAFIGDYTIHYLNDVENLYPYAVVAGSLLVEPLETIEVELPNLTAIYGTLDVNVPPGGELVYLNLENLLWVGAESGSSGQLDISGSSSIFPLNLPSLEHVSGPIWVENNTGGPQDITLPSLKTVGGRQIKIQNSESLQTVHLPALAPGGIDLCYINENASLESITIDGQFGGTNLNLHISQNPVLTDLVLGPVVTVFELIVGGNDSLESISFPELVKQGPGPGSGAVLGLSGNDNVSSISLPNLEEVDHLGINSSDSLGTCPGDTVLDSGLVREST